MLHTGYRWNVDYVALGSRTSTQHNTATLCPESIDLAETDITKLRSAGACCRFGGLLRVSICMGFPVSLVLKRTYSIANITTTTPPRLLIGLYGSNVIVTADYPPPPIPNDKSVHFASYEHNITCAQDTQLIIQLPLTKLGVSMILSIQCYVL